GAVGDRDPGGARHDRPQPDRPGRSDGRARMNDGSDLMNDRCAQEPGDRLYQLLPAVYRMRDAEQGYPLQALLAVVAEQVEVVEDDIEQLYANWFVETAEEWAVPYIGDLVGYRPVLTSGEAG